MRILVTGGTGFAGTHLIKELLSQGMSDIYSTTMSDVDPTKALLPADHYKKVDLSDAEATASIVRELHPEWLFHLASFAYVGKSFEKARELFANNINLQLNVLEAVRVHSPTTRILTIGSAEEYGVIDPTLPSINENCPLNPVNPYAISKVTQDLLANSYYLSYKLNVIRARPFNHIGTGQTGDFAVPAFVKQIVAIERGQQDKLLVGNLTGVRDFTSASDTVKAYILLMQKGTVGEVYNIGSGIGIPMSDIVKMLTEMAQKPITVAEDPTRLRPLDVPKLIADNTKVRSLGWQPTTDIRPTLEQVLNEWRTT